MLLELDAHGPLFHIEITNALDTNAPSWSTHSYGFTCKKVWEIYGNGWGTIPPSIMRRTIYESLYAFCDVDPVRGIGQFINSSNEVVFVRGGGKYIFVCSRGVVPTLITTSITVSNQTIAPTTTAPAEIVRNNQLTTDSITWNRLTDKPTTLSGYGITDALPLNGTAANAAQLGGKAASMYFVNNGNRGAVDFDTQYIDGIEYTSELSTNGGVPYAIIYTAVQGDAGMQANFGRNSALQYRSYQGSRWFDWRTVYDDHNANDASTVWSAKRLATPYNLICPFTWAQNNGITGTLVLSLPYGFNSMMQCIELTVYDYSSVDDGSAGATKIFIDGYNYIQGR